MPDSYAHVYSNEEQLEEYWRSLGKIAEFIIRVKAVDFIQALAALEYIGACALHVKPYDGHDFLISAYKGKQGPCYDTGRKATLTLDGFAAMDDDGHLLWKDIPVCEKTGSIYQLNAYQAFITVTDPDPDLMARYASDPKDFDCDNLEELAKDCSTAFNDDKADCSTTVCYAGPFKLLIAPDGSMLWRGQLLHASPALVKILKKAQVDLVNLPENIPAQKISYYDQKYQQRGAGCLIGQQLTSIFQPERAGFDFSVLHQCSQQFLRRLRNMLDQDQDYMIITGSDPGDPMGCCPSEDVAQANALVDAGILESRKQASGGDTCPISLYACRGEFIPGHQVQVSKDPSLRSAIVKRIQGDAPALTMALRWALLLFVLVSLVLGLQRLAGDLEPAQDVAVNELLLNSLEVPQGDNVIIALFREQKRCDFCLKMEAYAQKTLSVYFEDDKNVIFRNVNIELPSNKSLSEKLDLFTSTVVLFEIRDGNIFSSHIVEEAWSLINDEDQFAFELRNQIERIRGNW